MKKFCFLFLLSVFVFAFVISCATTGSSSANYQTAVNLSPSDLVLGERIEVSGKFSDKEIESGRALQVLTAQALKDTNYDFIFMPRLQKTRNVVTLFGRPARIK